MELELVYNMWDVLQTLIIVGFMIGVSVMVITSAIRLGWLIAPYVFLTALVIYLLSNM